MRVANNGVENLDRNIERVTVQVNVLQIAGIYWGFQQQIPAKICIQIMRVANFFYILSIVCFSRFSQEIIKGLP